MEAYMDMALALFTKKEIERILVGRGFERGSPEFDTEIRRRFRPAEGSPGLFVETDFSDPLPAAHRMKKEVRPMIDGDFCREKTAGPDVSLWHPGNYASF